MKAAVFDVDGTLVDSIDFWTNMATNYLISIGIKPKEDLNKALETLTVVEGVSYMQKEYNIEKTCTQIRNEMDELMFAFYKNDAQLKSFVVEILETLKSKNIQIAIASVINEELIFSVLHRYGIADYFQFVQTCENTDISKDDEKFYELLIKRLNLKAEEIFLFEDSLYCMKAAKRAGLSVIAVEDEFSKKDLKEIIEVSDIFIKNFGNLIPFLNV